MKSIVCAICLICGIVVNTSAQKREKYEFMRNLPTYADSLIADLTYPLAWGNNDIKDFDEWKQTARQKVFDCMLTPPPAPANGYETKVLFEEQRDGYKARKLRFVCLVTTPFLPMYSSLTAKVPSPLSMPCMTMGDISLSVKRK